MAVECSYDAPWIRVRFNGAITGADLNDVAGFIRDVESRTSPAPDRVVDIGVNTTLAIRFGEVAGLADQRRAIVLANPIRTAVVAHSAAQQGYARMFQTLNDHPLITIQVFRDLAAAEAWLRGSSHL
jgi:hypothetical protein